MIHAAKIENSDRLSHLLSCLRTGPKTTAQLSHECRDVAVHTGISELRAGGIPVDCNLVHVEKNTRRRVYEYRLAGVA